MSHLRILLAAHPTLRRSEYESELRKQGFELLTADDALACLDALKSFCPDILVIEPELRWGGGDGVLAVAHEDLRLDQLPVMVLVTDVQQSATYSIARYRISDFAAQQLPPEQLANRIRRLAFGSLLPGDGEYASPPAAGVGRT